jgi:hypothetical protein
MKTQTYLLVQNNHQLNYNYEIMPIQNLTKDRLCSIQAKYNLENQQKKFLEQQLYLTLNPKIPKTNTRLTEIFEYEDNNEDLIVEAEQQFFNRFETQHFLMKNRLTKHIFLKTLNIFSLKFKQKKLNKLVSFAKNVIFRD